VFKMAVGCVAAPMQEVRSEGGLEGDIVVMQLEASRTILPGNQLNIRYNHYTQV
jgi:hypothetical protein